MESIDALAQDIQRNGQLQEIVVMPKEGGRYELVAGKRRTLALRHLNWQNIRALSYQRAIKAGLGSQQDKISRILAGDDKETKAPVEPVRPFQFAWKNGTLAIKMQPFKPEHDSFSNYVRNFVEAGEEYMAAFPAPAPQSHAQAAEVIQQAA